MVNNKTNEYREFMKKSKIECAVRGNQHGHWINVSGMSKKEYNTFFRIGLQAFADERHKGQVKVIGIDDPIAGYLKAIKKVEFGDEQSDYFVGQGIIVALKEQIALVRKSTIIDYIRKHKKVRVSKVVQDFYTEYK